MMKSDQFPTQNEADLIKNSLNSLESRLKNFCEALITNELDMINRSVKTQVKSVFDAIETMQSSQTVFQKEINLRIGAITGAQKSKERRKAEDQFLTPPMTYEEALAFQKSLNEKPQERGPAVSGKGNRIKQE